MHFHRNLQAGFVLSTIFKQVLSGFNCGPYEKELLKALLHDYERQNRPVLNETEPLVLTFGVTLQQIIDVVSFSSKVGKSIEANLCIRLT